MTTRNLTRASLAFVAAVLTHGGDAGAADFRACIDRSSPTASMDTRLAHALAVAQGGKAVIANYDGTGGERGFRLRNYAELVGERCDFVLGFPLAGSNGLPDGVRATRPYAHTAFVLVTRAGETVSGTAALPDGTPVAVTYNTTPNLWFHRHPNLVRSIFETDAESLAAIEARDVTAAMLWRPAAMQEMERSGRRDAFHFSPLEDREAEWDLVALYAATNDVRARAFESAVASLRADGRLAKVLDGYADVVPAPAQLAPVAHGARPLVAVDNAVKATRASAARCATADKPKKPAKGKGKGPPALFTAEQAEQGKAIYLEKCSFCHAPDLNGRAGPALRGKFFASAEHKYKLSDIFTIVSQNMPSVAPGSLSHDEYVKIMSWILLNNGYPAGAEAMTFDAIRTSKVPLRFYAE